MFDGADGGWMRRRLHEQWVAWAMWHGHLRAAWGMALDAKCVDGARLIEWFAR